MIKLLALATTGILMACQANANDPEDTLHAHIGMTVADFNAQPFVLKRQRSIPTSGAAWTGYNGGFDLITKLGDQKVVFPISGNNGGIQLAAEDYPDYSSGILRVTTLSFTVDPQRISYDEAVKIAASYCDRAAAAGLTIAQNAHISKEQLLASKKEDARKSINGIAACDVRNDLETFVVSIVPIGLGDSDPPFRVEVSIGRYIEVNLQD